jgi:hypothetical protein
VHSEDSLAVVIENLEKGYFGIGEVVAASTYSPIASTLEWKGNHPMDGYFPEIYEICEKYKAPLLLHIDPPYGFPIIKFEQALTKYPNTIFIFAHANGYNTPKNIQKLLSKYNNLYIDFFAGFTAYNKESLNNLLDYVPLINEYPNRFLVSSDSGYGVGYDKAYKAIYELFDLLEQSVVEKIAYRNFEEIIEAQPITQYQREKIEEISSKLKIELNVNNMNKKEANEWIIKYK